MVCLGRERLINDFNQKLQYSLGEQQNFDHEILKRHIPNCERIEKTDIETDKTGIDYIAVINDGVHPGGTKIYIDAKTRERGCSKYWHNGEPELAIETWSVVGSQYNKAVPGWTFKTNTNVDYILYTFHESDSKQYFFIPFQLLRKAARENYSDWIKRYPLKRQNQTSGRYQSEAMFVPASVVLEAIRKTMIGVRPG